MNVDGVTRLSEDHPLQGIDPVEWLDDYLGTDPSHVAMT